MKVQARMLVPAWNLFRAAHAFKSVSWTRSSARSRLPESDRPKARRCGMTVASCSLKSGSESGTSSCFASVAASCSNCSATNPHPVQTRVTRFKMNRRHTLREWRNGGVRSPRPGKWSRTAPPPAPARLQGRSASCAACSPAALASS